MASIRAKMQWKHIKMGTTIYLFYPQVSNNPKIMKICDKYIVVQNE
jgi:hypothetical protein